MGWLLLWVGIGLLNLAVLAGCAWMLWRKGRALWRELAAQGRTVGELIRTFEELGLGADRTGQAGVGPLHRP